MRFRCTLLGISMLALTGNALAQAQPERSFVESPYVVTPDHQFVTKGGLDQVSSIIYVNSCQPDGCFVRAGTVNDAIQNVSTVPQQSAVLSPFAHDQTVWDATIECLRQVYGPYNVEIVTEDPGAVPHHEAMLAGSADELGLPPEVGGVAPFSCEPQNNVISFSFSNSQPPDWIDLCWTVAQESAHAFGLDHAFECLDPMTYIPNCGQKFFRDKALPCGEFEERTCMCTGATQNSHRLLLTVFGQGTLPPPPQVAITTPGDGGTVQDEDTIVVMAADPRLVDHVEFVINGWLYETRPGNSFFDNDRDYYVFTLPASLPDSVLDIEVTAYNDLDLAATAAITVTKGGPCASAETCLDGQECSNGRCFWPEPTGELGDACEQPMDCVSLLCPQAGDVKLCSEYCEPGLQDQCPQGFECLPAQGTGVCWPVAAEEGEGGCCSAGQERGPSGGQIALFLLVGAWLLGRRKRAS